MGVKAKLVKTNKNIRAGDQVIVISGKNSGFIGVCIKRSKDYLQVEGLNLIKHIKPDPRNGIKGGRIEKPLSLHCSNVAIYNEQAKCKDKIKYIFKNGEKIRIFSSTGNPVNYINELNKKSKSLDVSDE